MKPANRRFYNKEFADKACAQSSAGTANRHHDLFQEDLRMSYLNKKILSSLIATATLGSLAAVPAFAQNNQPAAADSLETVLVTGTRRSDVTALQSSAPIDVISAAALIESGASDAVTLIDSY